MRRIVFLIACLAPLAGCASFQAFMERDEARVRSWQSGDVEPGSVCVVVGEECRYVPGEVYAEEGPAIDAAARRANKSWRQNRPLAADEISAR